MAAPSSMPASGTGAIGPRVDAIGRAGLTLAAGLHRHLHGARDTKVYRRLPVAYPHDAKCPWPAPGARCYCLPRPVGARFLLLSEA